MIPSADWEGKPVVLTLEKIGKAYGARRVLRGFSLFAEGGEVVAIVGPNGSGKSTLLKMVAGLLRPSTGTVTMQFGNKKWGEAAARRAAVGYAGPDLTLYPELTGMENLRFFDAVAGRKRTPEGYAALFAEVGLARGRENDPVGAYSSGMRQRMRLAFSRLANVPVLLFDEPSLALDAGGVDVVSQIVAAQKARGGLTLLATNDPREAALGDRSVAMAG